MNKAKRRQFRRDRANELRSLARVLTHEGIIRDDGPLQHAAEECQSLNSDEWGYSFSELIFYTDPSSSLRHIRPKGAEIDSFELNVSLKGMCLDDDDPSDPFNQLAVDIIINGISNENTSLKCAWHLDKHQRTNDDGVSNFAHPEYHFQHGGRHVWELEQFGFQLLLEPPRLAHPPLDGILAVDFIISNYLGGSWLKLLEDATYLTLVQSSQERCWKPYARATAAIWKSIELESSWSAKHIWPQIVASL
jgi:hypothetical protein